jgi:hypothetical protein
MQEAQTRTELRREVPHALPHGRQARVSRCQRGEQHDHAVGGVDRDGGAENQQHLQ